MLTTRDIVKVKKSGEVCYLTVEILMFGFAATLHYSKISLELGYPQNITDYACQVIRKEIRSS
jgi:hypothetical protein